MQDKPVPPALLGATLMVGGVQGESSSSGGGGELDEPEVTGSLAKGRWSPVGGLDVAGGVWVCVY